MNIDLDKAIQTYSSNIAVLEKYKKQLHSSQVVFVIGRSQAGKSTFLNFLKDSNVLKANGAGQIILTDVSQGLQIGGGKQSCTEIPNVIEIEGTYFIDCPGFEDTSLQKELSNAAYIKHLTSFCQDIKILLVVDAKIFRKTLDASKQAFQDLYNFVGESFTHNLWKSVKLVLTKVVRNEVKQLNKRIQDHIDKYTYSNSIQESKSVQIKEFIQQIVNNRVQFYNADEITIGNSHAERRDILNLIKSSPPMGSIIIKCSNPVISHEAIQMLSNSLTNQKTKAMKHLGRIIDQITQSQGSDINELQVIEISLQKLNNALTQKTNYQLVELLTITEILIEWIQSNNFQILIKYIKKLQYIHEIFYFYSGFSYCIEILKSAIDIDQCCLNKLQNHIVYIQNKIQIDIKTQEVKKLQIETQVIQQNTLVGQLKLQKIEMSLILQQQEVKQDLQDLENFKNREKSDLKQLQKDLQLMEETMQTNNEKDKVKYIQIQNEFKQKQQNTQSLVKLAQENISIIEYEQLLLHSREKQQIEQQRRFRQDQITQEVALEQKKDQIDKQIKIQAEKIRMLQCQEKIQQLVQMLGSLAEPMIANTLNEIINEKINQ